MHKFFAVSLPQFAAVLANHNVQLEIVVHQGGRILFPDPDPYEGEEEEEELNESQQFSAEYWELLSPVLTKLVLCIEGEIYIDRLHWLSSMQKLQHLELRGLDHMDGPQPALFFPRTLSLPAVKVLRLEKFSHIWNRCHLDCPSLEALHLRELDGLVMPTGLGSCSRLTTLDIAAARNAVPDADANPGLLAAIESVQTTLECLDISGWAPALNGVFELISRLPRLHTFVAQRNGLTAVPALPATLKSLDLRANEFTEVPVQLESLTQLTSLALSSKDSSVNFQIRRPLDAIISLPQLQKLTLVLDSRSHRPAHTIWNARSLHYFGLAKYEIARSKSSLLTTMP
ncbi:hypothetical protein COCOBI_02-8340 [Coccomyxa sp. Obi]|nr:hypothetical protein COCOBI_02-8340 [Coccomyxa sp. Obi]